LDEMTTGDVVDGSPRPSIHLAVCDWIDVHRGEIERAWREWVSGKAVEEIPGAAD
jgi:hypothetical protein